MKQLLAAKAKAFLAALGTLVAGEVVNLLTDAALQAQVRQLVPPAEGFIVPVVFSLIVGVIVHQVPNAAAEEQHPADGTETDPLELPDLH